MSLLPIILLACHATADFLPIALTNDRDNYFGLELFKILNEENPGNVVVSPASVKAALTALVEGSGGETRSELQATLKLPKDIGELRENSRNYLAPHFSGDGVEFDSATRLWVGNNVQVKAKYADAVQRYYGADIYGVDFGNAPFAAKTINDWVSEATRHNIRSIIDADGIRSDTRLILTSALYFRARWLHAFDPKATRLRCFHLANGGCVDVNLMESEQKYRYGYIRELEAEAIEIPYANRRFSMLVLLPRERGIHGLKALSTDLAHGSIASYLSKLEETEVLLQLPRFSIETKLTLREHLERMGIRQLFSLKANLSELLANRDALIDNVRHNARIEVSEQGTIAAATTTLEVVPLMGNTIPEFRADRPFIFALIDRRNNNMLFAGSFVDPQQ